LTKSLPLFLSFESGRKQKTPKKFTGEQPSISGTFGLKGNALGDDSGPLQGCRFSPGRLREAPSPRALPVVEIHDPQPGDIVLEELVPLAVRVS